MVTTWDNLEKAGTLDGGWSYNEVGLAYNQVLDPDTDNTVYYNGLGVNQSWINVSPKTTSAFTNASKTSSTWSNQTKI